MRVATGTFDPRGGHDLRGGFTIHRTDKGLLFETTEDFFFDGAANPGFALTKDDIYNQGTAQNTDFLRLAASHDIFGAQIPVQGVQSCYLPENIDLSSYDRVFLWCYTTPFLMGVGAFSAP